MEVATMRRFLVVCALLICFGVLGCGPPIHADAPSDIVITRWVAEDLHGEFRADRQKFTDKYSGKVFELRGFVYKVDEKGIMYLVVSGYHDLYPCGTVNVPAGIRGREVVVKGHVYMGDPFRLHKGDAYITLYNCIVVEQK
jgi:hypothetical protein